MLHHGFFSRIGSPLQLNSFYFLLLTISFGMFTSCFSIESYCGYKSLDSPFFMNGAMNDYDCVYNLERFMWFECFAIETGF